MNSHRNIISISLTLAVLSVLSHRVPAVLATSQFMKGSPIAVPWKTMRILPGVKSSTASNTPITLPTVPPTPAPSGGRTGQLGSLNGNSCPKKQHELTALAPENVHGLTLSEHPTFWFYVPFTSEELQLGEFSILTWDEEQQIYATSFALPETPGFVSVSLPTSGEVSLEEGQPYHWYANFYCAASLDADADLRLNGWVQRVARTPEREQQVSNATPDIWYDATNHLAEKLQVQSADAPVLKQTWIDLLDSVGLGDLSQAPFVDSANGVETP